MQRFSPGQSLSIMRDAGNDVKLSDLRSLRELQLCMFGMKTTNLNDMTFMDLSTPDGVLDWRCSFCRWRSTGAATGEELSRTCSGKVDELQVSCHCNEIELVHFLFRKANFLQRLILVAPNPNWVHPGQ
ncbi:uncharacterized protein LOC107304467 [Oryza brachyantha]|uniref:uncharacterized protein LOC107304467 n=1 Tax=Oryza brachyantha TaxID=4533 RepID=UPI0007760838|nr:uncharacterized protein LOC107304467 [Oryza brachyantha]